MRRFIVSADLWDKFDKKSTRFELEKITYIDGVKVLKGRDLKTGKTVTPEIKDVKVIMFGESKRVYVATADILYLLVNEEHIPTVVGP